MRDLVTELPEYSQEETGEEDGGLKIDDDSPCPGGTERRGGWADVEGGGRGMGVEHGADSVGGGAGVHEGQHGARDIDEESAVGFDAGDLEAEDLAGVAEADVGALEGEGVATGDGAMGNTDFGRSDVDVAVIEDELEEEVQHRQGDGHEDADAVDVRRRSQQYDLSRPSEGEEDDEEARREPRRNPAGGVAEFGAHSTRMTSRVRGPWTPLMRIISMSEVAEGPEIVVSGAGRRAAMRRMPSGTVATSWERRTTQRW